MGLFALILGLLGALCAIMGIVTAAEVVPLTIGASALVDWMFWLIVSGVLFLATIAVVLGGREME